MKKHASNPGEEEVPVEDEWGSFLPFPSDFVVFTAECDDCYFKCHRVYNKCRLCKPYDGRPGKKGPNMLSGQCCVDGCWGGLTCDSHVSQIDPICSKCNRRTCGKCLEEVREGEEQAM